MSEMNVYQRLQKARIDLQNAKIKKSGKNAYANFSYFELKDFIPTVNNLFDKYGLSSNFSIIDDMANLYIINADKPEENILFTSPIAETQLKGCTPIQALGAIHTYMKRYLYLNAFEIVEDDLLDAQAGNIKPTEKKTETKEIKYFCSSCGKEITKKVADFSNGKYGTELCYDCQIKCEEGKL